MNYHWPLISPTQTWQFRQLISDLSVRETNTEEKRDGLKPWIKMHRILQIFTFLCIYSKCMGFEQLCVGGLFCIDNTFWGAYLEPQHHWWRSCSVGSIIIPLSKPGWKNKSYCITIHKIMTLTVWRKICSIFYLFLLCLKYSLGLLDQIQIMYW